MCLVLLWNSGFSASFNNPWLLTSIIGVLLLLLLYSCSLRVKYLIVLFKYIFSLVASFRAIYSAL